MKKCSFTEAPYPYIGVLAEESCLQEISNQPLHCKDSDSKR